MSSGDQRDDNMLCPTDTIPALVAVLNLTLLMQKKPRGFWKLFRIPWIINIFVVCLDRIYIQLFFFIPFKFIDFRKVIFVASVWRAT